MYKLKKSLYLKGKGVYRMVVADEIELMKKGWGDLNIRIIAEQLERIHRLISSMNEID